jgi:biotin transporter BioY
MALLFRVGVTAFFLSLLTLLTFVHVQAPFVAVLPPQLAGAQVSVQSGFLTLGTYSTNLQLVALFACLMCLDVVGALGVVLLYLILGLGGVPLFYYGGGWDYLQQSTIGYLFSFVPACLIFHTLLRRNRQPHPSLLRYVWATVVTLLGIHVVGGIYAAIYYETIPIQFLLTYDLPQLPWQLAALVVLAVVVRALNSRWQKLLRPRARSLQEPPSIQGLGL